MNQYNISFYFCFIFISLNFCSSNHIKLFDKRKEYFIKKYISGSSLVKEYSQFLSREEFLNKIKKTNLLITEEDLSLIKGFLIVFLKIIFYNKYFIIKNIGRKSFKDSNFINNQMEVKDKIINSYIYRVIEEESFYDYAYKDSNFINNQMEAKDKKINSYIYRVIENESFYDYAQKYMYYILLDVIKGIKNDDTKEIISLLKNKKFNNKIKMLTKDIKLDFNLENLDIKNNGLKEHELIFILISFALLSDFFSVDLMKNNFFINIYLSFISVITFKEPLRKNEIDYVCFNEIKDLFDDFIRLFIRFEDDWLKFKGNIKKSSAIYFSIQNYEKSYWIGRRKKWIGKRKKLINKPKEVEKENSLSKIFNNKYFKNGLKGLGIFTVLTGSIYFIRKLFMNYRNKIIN